MRTLTIFSITIILMACLFAGCGGDDDDDDVIGPDGADGVFMGMTSMTAGSWSEHTDLEGNRYKMEFHGTDTYNGRDSFVMEFDMESDGGTVTSQVWIEKSTGESVLYVMKQGALIIKLDVSQVPEVVDDVSDSEGDDTSDDTVKVGTETYTTPTGKSVEATVYRDSSGESWISAEVPFGMVKSISDGEVDSELYDFGSSGATRDISKEEAENAEAFSFPGLDDLDIPDF
ncbi:hypothetical protein ACFL6S_16995 [Candidatus Poribacteria bacterium]